MKLNKLKTNASSRLMLGMLAGSILGYLFYAFYGCDGSCAISSSPFNSTLYGTVVGALVSRRFTSADRK